MKAVILAGGYGTRISEETHLKPKPMVEIGADLFFGIFLRYIVLWHKSIYYLLWLQGLRH